MSSARYEECIELNKMGPSKEFKRMHLPRLIPHHTLPFHHRCVRLMDYRAWKDLPEAILALDIQNEGQGHMQVVNPNWVCTRATNLCKIVTDRRILIGTGGGVEVQDSIIPKHFACPDIDIVDLHSYDVSLWGPLADAVKKAKASGKRIIFEEFGAEGAGRADKLRDQNDVFTKLGLP